MNVKENFLIHCSGKCLAQGVSIRVAGRLTVRLGKALQHSNVISQAVFRKECDVLYSAGIYSTKTAFRDETRCCARLLSHNSTPFDRKQQTKSRMRSFRPVHEYQTMNLNDEYQTKQLTNIPATESSLYRVGDRDSSMRQGLLSSFIVLI